jgi:hypothetical protein
LGVFRGRQQRLRIARHERPLWVGRVIGVLTLTPYDFWRHLSEGVRSSTRDILKNIHRNSKIQAKYTFRKLDEFNNQSEVVNPPFDREL